MKIESVHIAPCGFDCALCSAFQGLGSPCAGCNGDPHRRQGHCAKCVIKRCQRLQASLSGFCYDCEKHPCRRLRQLDEKYRRNWRISMLDNLAYIREKGMEAFLRLETARYTCGACGEIACVHRQVCLHCGAPFHSDYIER